jgi:hypothetical protein
MEDEIKNIIEKKEYNFYGLRVMTENPVTGEDQVAEVGGYVENSYNWDCDGYIETEELEGVSAIIIKGEEGIEEAIKRAKPYWSGQQVALLGSIDAENGNDPYEIIMSNHDTVLAVWNDVEW